MRRAEPEVRAAVIDEARRWAGVQAEIRQRTAEMRQERCSRGTGGQACWAIDATRAWANPKAALPDSYCGACRANTALARERHALRRQAAWRRKRLLAAVAALERSFWAAAVPLPLRARGAKRGERRERGKAKAQRPPRVRKPRPTIAEPGQAPLFAEGV